MTEIIWNAGFDEIRFSDHRYDTFSDAPHASSAESFGTQGVNIWAVKPAGERRGPRPGATAPVQPADEPARDEPLPEPDRVYDAGALGCGDGPLLQIAGLLRGMAPGTVLEVRSTDSGVVADLPAWCRMVGHEYLGGGQGAYAGRHFVRRKKG